MKQLQSHLCGEWIAGDGAKATLVNPATEEPVAEIATGGTDMSGAVRYGREKGGAVLREMTFAQRGELLTAMSRAIHAHRDELLSLAMKNCGNTRGDAKFDVDGASGTLAYYAELGKKIGDKKLLVDGEAIQLSRSPRFCGQHVQVSRRGVAVHINAFNFPAWGPAEKAATAILAGMPVLTKAATATAHLTHRITEIFVEEKVLPQGVFQLLLGPVGNLFDQLGGQDVLAFTGSGATGAKLRGDARLVEKNVRVNVEADSLNAAVLASDVEVGSATWDLFVADVVRDMTQKTGQKCTAIRRVMVPEAMVDDVVDVLSDRLAGTKVGNPEADGVRMGPLATAQQLTDVKAGLAALQKEASSVYGDDGAIEAIGAPAGKGFFIGPVLLKHSSPANAKVTHELEVFGPIATLLPYDGSAKMAADWVGLGAGGLVSSAYSDDRTFLAELVHGIAPYHGRLYLGSDKIAGQTPGPGTVLPQLVHGGPGRAGAGEELGAERGMAFYMQRTALEGDRAILGKIIE